MALLLIGGMLLAACGGTGGQPAATSAPAAGEATTAPAAAEATTAPTTEATTASAPADATATTAPAEATTAPAAEATTAPAAGGEGPRLNPDVSGTVEFWHFWGSPVRRNAIRRVIALCQAKLPNITVNETFKPFGDIWTANIAAVSAGSGMPDVIVEDRPSLPQRAADGIATDLQERAQADGVSGDQFYEFAWNQTLYEGKTYGIPFETDVTVLFWNKNAFKEAGLDPEKPPTTWAEAEEYAAKLDKKAADGSYERIGMFPLINRGADIWAYANDVEWISADGTPQVNSPQAVETLEWIKGWVDRYGGWPAIQEFRGQFAAPPNDPFMSGKVAMIVDIAGYSSQLNFYRPQVPTAADPTKRENLDWGVSDMPYKTDKGTWSGGFALSIPTGAKNQDAAWEFIKCASGPEGQASWARDTYAIPTNIQAANDPVLAADPNWKVFAGAMEYSTGGNQLPQYTNWSEQLSQRYEQIWTGEISAKDALDQAQQAIEEQVSAAAP
jgi:multiple sugar transport system substrate-binding protein